jgi:ATP-dependent phosphoenolpyruvate carboxykinase
MKVKIQQRSVYHKFAEIEIDIPNHIDDVEKHILDIEEKWVDELDHKLNCSEFIKGNGVDEYLGMNEKDSEDEYRYQCDKLNTGGHL